MSQRDAIFATIPDSYRGQRHFLLLNALAGPLILLPLLSVHAPSAGELLAVPLALLLANYGEWAIHRYLLHRRVPGLHILFERHAVIHHGAFHHDSMAAPTPREWRWVLFPLPALLGLVALVGPLAALCGWLISANVGCLLFASLVCHYLLYEWLHLSYHQPPQSWVGQSALLQRLARQHRLHHHPACAKRYNFNVTVPLADWLRGTLAPATLVKKMIDGGPAAR